MVLESDNWKKGLLKIEKKNLASIKIIELSLSCVWCGEQYW